MKKKNIRPQQVAPVQRETTTANSSSPALVGAVPSGYNSDFYDPFAGDDAE
jgi:prenylated cyclic peptide (anacyclamide/piricyclamide family)